MQVKLFQSKKAAILLFILLFALMVFIIKSALTRQEISQKASTSTRLYLLPESSNANPITKKTGDSFTLDLMIDPGTAMASFIRFSLLYDQSKLTVEDTNSIVINTSSFPVLFEGPFVNPGRVDATVSVGSDPTRAVTAPTKVASITFKAISSTTNSISEISHKQDSSLVLSVGANESASQNVLELTQPAFVKITGDDITPIIPSELSTKFNVTVFLHGLGNSGDNPNPNTHSLSTKNPNHKTRTVVFELLNNKNEYVATREGNINYASASGNFSGQIDIGSKVPAGDYTIKIKSNQYLRNIFPGIQKVPSLEVIEMPQITLVTGDVLNDNKLNILDYNILYGCYKTELFPLPRDCTTEKNIQADLTDEGSVNMYDINLFIRELSVQAGL